LAISTYITITLVVAKSDPNQKSAGWAREGESTEKSTFDRRNKTKGEAPIYWPASKYLFEPVTPKKDTVSAATGKAIAIFTGEKTIKCIF